MQTELNSWKLAEDCPQRLSQIGLTCDTCGSTFQKPILARVSTSGGVQTYQACPRCMTKVYGAVLPKSEQRKTAVQPKGLGELGGRSGSSLRCGHFFGYLNKRQKGAPIPEHCLICAKMVECLHG
jgi:hypothetical protein